MQGHSPSHEGAVRVYKSAAQVCKGATRVPAQATRAQPKSARAKPESAQPTALPRGVVLIHAYAYATLKSVEGLDVEGQSPRWWVWVAVTFPGAWMWTRLHERERQIASAVAVVAVAIAVVVIDGVNGCVASASAPEVRMSAAAAGSFPGDSGSVKGTPRLSSNDSRLSK